MQYVNIPVYSGGQKKKDVITKTSYIHIKQDAFFFLRHLTVQEDTEYTQLVIVK